MTEADAIVIRDSIYTFVSLYACTRSVMLVYDRFSLKYTHTKYFRPYHFHMFNAGVNNGYLATNSEYIKTQLG